MAINNYIIYTCVYGILILYIMNILNLGMRSIHDLKYYNIMVYTILNRGSILYSND